ncbi:energy-coupling factor transporter transmembrane protein EcfT [Heliobacterium gestii]|uniref:Energy-coupling factor transporter transmembrane protein EcfT n=1 Tax=Heliomicrobium gestii TaxID=2699 RepID=A0A845LII2_HELGE|nr:energy-coupling factor transporter transmembrane component T [Heliomicrobium gestii]MBM7868092.1 energy-coupling factor transport system permease protein [Heliomicrobium gestii]MZP44379.1 energy-coupling factor transporter transmembrane protein EcfT [Heliomicrobium gestii]
MSDDSSNELWKGSASFLASLHPAAAMSYIAALLFLLMFIDHPLFLIGVFAVQAVAIAAAGRWDQWNETMGMALPMCAMILIINPLMVRAGETVLWTGPAVPLLGPLFITVEAVAYGAAMALKLLNVFSLFFIYSAIVQPDDLLRLFSGLAFRSALVISLATRLFPTMRRRLKGIREIQELRGVRFDEGSLRERMVKYAGLVEALLLSSLEDAMETAEAMEARAFGVGPRSTHRRKPWRRRDSLCVSGALFALLAAVAGVAEGELLYVYYPVLDPLRADGVTLLSVSGILAGLLIPVIMNWGWRKWTFIRSTI